LILLCLSSCAATNGEEIEYKKTDTETEVSFGEAESTSERNGYMLSMRRLNVAINGKSALSEEINGVLNEWLSTAAAHCDRLCEVLSANYDTERTFRAGCFVEYSDNGLLSLSLRVEYTESGERFSYIISGKTWDIGEGRELTATELLRFSNYDFENYLTMMIYPRIAEYPDCYPAELKSAAGTYSNHVGWVLNEGGCTFFIKLYDMEYYGGYHSFDVSFAANPSLFYYAFS
jgi:hypothetical protein